MVFNSLGSNYNFATSTKMLFARGRKFDAVDLKKILEEKYQGQATLLYKGRQAITMALKFLNLPQGSIVAINGFTCYAVYQPIVEAGLKAEYLDVADGKLNFSADELKKKLDAGVNIKAVIIQNTLGYVCDIENIAAICRQNNIILIEDLAHSAGAMYLNGQEAGTVGDFVILSFSQDKIIDAVSGGALVVRNKKYQNLQLPKIAQPAKKQQVKDRFYPNFTFKIRMDYLIGLGKFTHKIYKKLGLLSKPMGELNKIVFLDLPGWYCRFANDGIKNLADNLNRRRKISTIYLQNLNPQILIGGINLQIQNSTNLRFPIVVNNRASLISYLKNHNIHVADIWYDAPVAPKNYLALTDYNHQCPKAEKLSEQILNLPTHINVSEKEANKISLAINAWLKLQ